MTYNLNVFVNEHVNYIIIKAERIAAPHQFIPREISTKFKCNKKSLTFLLYRFSRTPSIYYYILEPILHRITVLNPNMLIYLADRTLHYFHFNQTIKTTELLYSIYLHKVILISRKSNFHAKIFKIDGKNIIYKNFKSVLLRRHYVVNY